MYNKKISSMSNGWFVGNFSPTLYATDAVEVAVKEYTPGAREVWHFHKIATELTVIVSGEVEMNGVRYEKGDVVVIQPGEGTDFHALTHVVTTVVKVPCVPNDKFFKH